MARKIPQLNTGSMADISFLLLTFFLLTSSINTDMGITRRLPPPLDPSVKPPEIKQRNIFTVLINQNNKLLVENRPSDLSLLKTQTKEFLTNPGNHPDLPEMETKSIPYLGDLYLPKNAVISLKNDRGTSYEMYVQVQNELTKAINELRDELSMEKFGVKFGQLTNEDYIEAVKNAIPITISEAEPENVGGK
ncbi:MAG: biopolymer transporter ExbD [Bacteroidetes bacterium]|nr:biopolymer transporter ExbD [Bacteroidota bacterium]